MTELSGCVRQPTVRVGKSQQRVVIKQDRHGQLAAVTGTVGACSLTLKELLEQARYLSQFPRLLWLDTNQWCKH